jgi:hypothetical protein
MTPENPTPNRQSALYVGPFTPEEAHRLSNVRAHLYEKAEYLDRVLDEQRLRFVRYLIENGDVSEGDGDA